MPYRNKTLPHSLVIEYCLLSINIAFLIYQHNHESNTLFTEREYISCLINQVLYLNLIA